MYEEGLLMTILQGGALGLIQGLGEFLPISSSGHLLLGRFFFGLQGDLTSGQAAAAYKVFDIMLHVGTLIPLLLVFWKDWLEMFRHPVRNKMLLHLVIASVPTLVMYLGAKVLIKADNGAEGFAIFDSGWFLGVSFLITALFLLLCDRVSSRRTPSARGVGFLQAVVMGIFQGFGLLPGVSRSGSTIFGGVLSGLDKKKAASFSFMMSAPAILGSLLLEGKDLLGSSQSVTIDYLPVIVGVLVAAAVGYLALRFMLKIVATVPLGRFAVYLAVIGIAFLVFQLAGSSLVPAFTPSGSL